MEPEITWYIQELNRDPVTGGVTRVHWRAIAVEGEYSAKSYGELGLEYDAQDAGFVEFESLDEEIVLSWVAQNMDMLSASMEMTLACCVSIRTVAEAV